MVRYNLEYGKGGIALKINELEWMKESPCRNEPGRKRDQEVDFGQKCAEDLRRILTSLN